MPSRRQNKKRDLERVTLAREIKAAECIQRRIRATLNALSYTNDQVLLKETALFFRNQCMEHRKNVLDASRAQYCQICMADRSDYRPLLFHFRCKCPYLICVDCAISYNQADVTPHRRSTGTIKYCGCDTTVDTNFRPNVTPFDLLSKLLYRNI